MVRTNVESVSRNKTLFEALQAMLTKNLNAMAVLQEDGKLLGALTFDNIQFILGGQAYGQLSRKCGDIVLQLQKDDKERHDVAYVSVSPETSLEDTIKRVVGHRIHRLWVLDNDNKPVGIVSLTDILSAFV